MRRNMSESLQGHGVPRQVVISRRSGNVTLVPPWRSQLTPCSYVQRQLIPGLRTRHSKCTGAKVRDRGEDNEVAMSGGSESWPDRKQRLCILKVNAQQKS